MFGFKAETQKEAGRVNVEGEVDEEREALSDMQLRVACS